MYTRFSYTFNIFFFNCKRIYAAFLRYGLSIYVLYLLFQPVLLVKMYLRNKKGEIYFIVPFKVV